MSWVILILVALLIMRFTRCGGMMAGGCGCGMLHHDYPGSHGEYGRQTAHSRHGSGPSADSANPPDGA